MNVYFSSKSSNRCVKQGLLLCSLNHQFFCWSLKSSLKVPWRSRTLGPLGTFRRRPRDVAYRLRSCSCCFSNCSFWSSLCCIRCRFFSTIKKFGQYLLLKFLPMFLAKDKNPNSLAYILSLGSTDYLIFITDFCLITKVKFILSSTSNSWLFWCVNHTSMSWNSELNVF